MSESNVLLYITAVLVVVITTVSVFVWWRYTYWRRLGVPYLPPSFPFGNLNDALMGRRAYCDVIHDLYRKLSDHPFAGIYMAFQPSMFVMEPEIIKDVMVRYSQSKFQHHVIGPDPKRDPLMVKNIFAARSPRWRALRSGLSPAFSSGKMKMMYPLVVDKGHQLTNKMEVISSTPDARVDMKLVFSAFTTDVIASCAFGIETNSLTNPENDFLRNGLRILERTVRRAFDTTIIFVFPSFVKLTRSVFIQKDIADFFRHIVWNVVKEREEKGIKRGDYLDLLIQLKNKRKVQVDDEETNGIPEKEKDNFEWLKYFGDDNLVAHALVFYFAGYETSSTASTFALFELAMNPECQEKLQKEIDTTLQENGGEMSYEAIHGMRYLDMVVSETLRKYPSLAALDRVCTEEYRNPEYNLVISKGTNVYIPTFGLHYDPKYYPNPEKFDPERFTEEVKRSRPNYCYMPFGEGPRICIGMRFGLMQVKVGLVSVLSKFKFSLSEEFKQMKTLPLDKKAFLISPNDGLTLIVNKRDGK